MSVFYSKQEDVSLRLDENETKVADMQWDPFESNFIITYQDGSMHLISYQGLNENTSIS